MKPDWQAFTEAVKAIVRPFIIFALVTTICIMWLNEQEIPSLLQMSVAGIAGEYILERAVKRLKE